MERVPNRAPLARGVMLGLCIMGLVGCGGGGGGGNVRDEPPPSTPTAPSPPPEPEPFATATAADLGAYRAVLETAAGPITIELFADRAPEHVRNFLRLAASGVFDGMAFHRVRKGFVIQTGSLSSRGPLTSKQQKMVRTLQPEFNATPHDRGIVSMARLSDPASATSSFFIVLGRSTSLDGQYTVFGRVVGGLDVLDKIEAAPLDGETPVTRIEVMGVRVVRP